MAAAARPFRQAGVGEEPCRPVEAAAVHRNRGVAEARQLIRRRVRVWQLCFCVVMEAAVPEAHLVVVEPHLGQARKGWVQWRPC